MRHLHNPNWCCCSVHSDWDTEEEPTYAESCFMGSRCLDCDCNKCNDCWSEDPGTAAISIAEAACKKSTSYWAGIYDGYVEAQKIVVEVEVYECISILCIRLEYRALTVDIFIDQIQIVHHCWKRVNNLSQLRMTNSGTYSIDRILECNH